MNATRRMAVERESFLEAKAFQTDAFAHFCLPRLRIPRHKFAIRKKFKLPPDQSLKQPKNWTSYETNN